jgi:hypothetical protein
VHRRDDRHRFTAQQVLQKLITPKIDRIHYSRHPSPSPRDDGSRNAIAAEHPAGFFAGNNRSSRPRCRTRCRGPDGSHPDYGGGNGGRADARLRGGGPREDGVTRLNPARHSSTTGIPTQAMRRHQNREAPAPPNMTFLPFRAPTAIRDNCP